MSLTKEAQSVAASAALLSNGTPLIDLRAPKEFLLGSFPHAINLPLMSDEDRHQVGLRYRQAGQAAAIALGEQLVSGEVRASRLQHWREALAAQPTSVLYCWRGGLRSSFVQHWLAASGVEIPRVIGGYKALRHIALDALTQIQTHSRPVFVLGGATGSGKTVLLRTFDATVDLEALAQHRGSAFGGDASAQPSQTSFENALACALLQQWRTPVEATFFEDEARMIGRCALPEALYLRLKSSPLVVVEVPRIDRALHIQSEYVDAPLATLMASGDATPHRTLATTLTDSLLRIRRRLGGLQLGIRGVVRTLGSLYVGRG